MLANAVSELERIAPGHYETLRARRALEGFRMRPGAIAAWFVLGAAVLGTLLHALRTARERPVKRGVALALFALGLGSALHSKPASAAAPSEAGPTGGALSKWPVNDADPKKSLPTTAERDRNPLEFGYHMMDLADKADVAARRGDFAGVGRYYEAMAVAVPDRAIGYRKSCEGYEKAGDAEKALKMCRGALAAEGTELGDFTHFAKLLFARPEPLAPVDVEDLSQIATHLKAEQGGMAAGLQIQCELAQRTDDLTRLQACEVAVAKETPADPHLILYRWGIAMKQENYARAKQLVEEAQKSTLLPAGVEIMARTTQEQSALTGRAYRGLRRHPQLLGALLALIALGGVGGLLRRRLRPGLPILAR